jgi:hypothetical protein
MRDNEESRGPEDPERTDGAPEPTDEQQRARRRARLENRNVGGGIPRAVEAAKNGTG